MPVAIPRIQIVLPKFRGAFQFLTDPRKKDINGNPLPEAQWSWEIMAMIDPVEAMTGSDRQRWQALIEAAKKVRDAFFNSGLPENYRSPLRDGTKYNAEHGNKYPEMVGKTLIHLKSKGREVKVCNARSQPILDKSQIYSGAYYIADGSWYGYNKLGNAGISFGLTNVMKLLDGEPLANVSNPEHAFREIDVTEYGVDNSAQFASTVTGATEDLI